MSNDPWQVQDNEARVYFAKCEVARMEKTASSGNKYFEMNIWLTPIEEGDAIVERRFFNFNPAWEKITIPSVMKLVQDGKIEQPSALEEKQHFISYRWAEYKNYAQRDIQYWKDRDASKLSVDEQGRTYKPVLGLEFLNLFTTEEEWRKAAEDAGNVNGDVQDDPMLEAAKAALPTIVKVCDTDMTQLQERLSHPPLNLFDVNSEEVKKEVATLITVQCGTDDEKRAAMLAEINQHFNGDTPYLTTEDLPEVPF
jgi:hypothetical protein